MDADFFAGFNKDLRDPKLWKLFNEGLQKKDPSKVLEANPPLPEIDAEWLFWEMMRVSRTPDKSMWPALKKLKESGKFIMGALSNTVIFPDDHEFNKDTIGRETMFDFFISSAHTGLRKPDPKIYQVALEEMNAAAQRKGIKQPVRACDVVFLDDIGQNLKPAKAIGMRTIKVNLGHIEDAVKELEKVTGLQLLENQAKL
jgi:epoxide hydrolase-like predicted phosphatase